MEENEKIKLELNPRRIDEPKTPYLSPMETDEENDALGERHCRLAAGQRCWRLEALTPPTIPRHRRCLQMTLMWGLCP